MLMEYKLLSILKMEHDINIVASALLYNLKNAISQSNSINPLISLCVFQGHTFLSPSPLESPGLLRPLAHQATDLQLLLARCAALFVCVSSFSFSLSI